MELDHRTKDNVRVEQLFHGTNASVIPLICSEGFKTDCNNRPGFGKGTYFSPDAAYSFTYMRGCENVHGVDVSYMFLADVLLGRPLVFSAADMKDMGRQVLDAEKYDHAEGMNGQEIVVSADDAIYPKYIIAFYKG